MDDSRTVHPETADGGPAPDAASATDHAETNPAREAVAQGTATTSHPAAALSLSPYDSLSDTPVLCCEIGATGCEIGATGCEIGATGCEIGAPARRVILTGCDAREATLLAMTAPGVGSTVYLKRESASEEAAGVTGLVVETRYNPSDARRCGFSVLLLEGSFRDSLLPPSNVKDRAGPSGFERRRHPRITVRLNGVMRIPGTNLDVTVGNLSMSGALIKSVERSLPDILDIGTLLHLSILMETRAPLLTLKAEVARLIGVGRPKSAGLRFIDLTSQASATLEQLILDGLLEI